MSEHILLKDNFFDLIETVKLERKLGVEGIVCLLKLWVWTVRNRTEDGGCLYDMDIEDIEIASKWKGDNGKFVQALVELGWLELDKESNEYKLGSI